MRALETASKDHPQLRQHNANRLQTLGITPRGAGQIVSGEPVNTANDQRRIQYLSEAFREEGADSPRLGVVAHELAHVIQQNSSGSLASHNLMTPPVPQT
jgi:hypothetical protein